LILSTVVTNTITYSLSSDSSATALTLTTLPSSLSARLAILSNAVFY